jgi:hypothetical protein
VRCALNSIQVLAINPNIPNTYNPAPRPPPTKTAPSPNPNQSNLNSIQRRQHNIRSKPPLPPAQPTPFLNPFKSLQHPTRRIRHLGQRKILPQTNPRSTVEGDISPGNRGPGPPSFGGKVVYGGAEEVLSALHDEGAVAAGGIFGDGDGLRKLLAVAG